MLERITLWFFVTSFGLSVVAGVAWYFMTKHIKKVLHDNISKGKTFKIRVAED